MADNRVAANREEMAEMLADACDMMKIPRHRNQPEETSMEIGDPQTSVMTIGKFTLYIILISIIFLFSK